MINIEAENTAERQQQEALENLFRLSVLLQELYLAIAYEGYVNPELIEDYKDRFENAGINTDELLKIPPKEQKVFLNKELRDRKTICLSFGITHDMLDSELDNRLELEKKTVTEELMIEAKKAGITATESLSEVVVSEKIMHSNPVNKKELYTSLGRYSNLHIEVDLDAAWKEFNK